MFPFKSPATEVSSILFSRLLARTETHDIDADTVIRKGDVAL